MVQSRAIVAVGFSHLKNYSLVEAHTECNSIHAEKQHHRRQHPVQETWWSKVHSPRWSTCYDGSPCAFAMIAHRNTTYRILPPCIRRAFCCDASACDHCCGQRFKFRKNHKPRECSTYRWSWRLNAFPHIVHTYLRSSLWVSLCFASAEAFPNIFAHTCNKIIGKFV